VDLYPIDFPGFNFHCNTALNLSSRFKKVCANGLIIISKPFFFLQHFYKLFSLLRRLKPDILHINNGGYPGALSGLAASVAGSFAGVSTVIMVVNNMAVGYSGISRKLDYPIDWMVARSVNFFITGSKAAKNRLVDVLTLSPAKVYSVHNGISIPTPLRIDCSIRDRLGLQEFKGVVFGVVAHLIPRKGHIFLLQAVRLLVHEKGLCDGDFKVLIEGDGPQRDILEDYVRQNELSNWILFVGNEREIFSFIANLDALILPSIYDEDFPNVNLEAMALGRAVISSDLAGTPEQIVHGKTGLLVEPENVQDLASAILYLIKDPEKRALMGEAGLRHFKDNFTSEHAVNNYNKIYKKLLGI
jgi:glycosyltransferase involved in cell wall biosynthesis